jgi:hypothetical protein
LGRDVAPGVGIGGKAWVHDEVSVAGATSQRADEYFYYYLLLAKKAFRMGSGYTHATKRRPFGVRASLARS